MSVDVPQASRDVLARLAEQMLPGGAGQPSAGAVDVSGVMLDQVLAARPDLREPLLALLDRVAGMPPAETLDAVRAEPADRELLGLVVVGAYTMAPAVRQALGYPGQEARQVNPFDINDVIEDGLLDPVIERGSIYRPTPRSAAG